MIIFGTASTGLWRVSDGGGTPSESPGSTPRAERCFMRGPVSFPTGGIFSIARWG